MFQRVAKKVREYLVSVIRPEEIGFKRVNDVCQAVVRGVVEELPNAYVVDEEEVLAISTAKLLGNSDPSFTKITDNGSGSTGIYAQSFSGTQLNEIFIQFKIPTNHVPGTDVNVYIYIYPSAAGDGDVVFDCEKVIVSPGSGMGDSSVEQVTLPIPADSEKVGVKCLLFTISGATNIAGNGVGLRLARRADLPEDTHDTAIWVTRVGVERKVYRIQPLVG